jgi:hypothetical protein
MSSEYAVTYLSGRTYSSEVIYLLKAALFAGIEQITDDERASEIPYQNRPVV